MKIKDGDRCKKIKGIRVRVFNDTAIAVSCVLYIVLICITYQISNLYRQTVQYTDEYISCRKDAATIKAASDYLTNQVRLCTQNNDLENLKLYFEEANVKRRREYALGEIEKRGRGSEESREELREAILASDELMEREIYAMKLVAVANGWSAAELPEQIQNTDLSEEDKKLRPDEMSEKAKKLVFDTDYQQVKAVIDGHISQFSDSILSDISSNHSDSLKSLAHANRYQRFYMIILFFISILISAVTVILIINPLKAHVRNLEENNSLDVIGAYELKYLAQTYNYVYEKNARHEASLVKKSEHDSLTGLLNRSVFDKLKDKMKDDALPICLLLMDIDNFKQINDRLGHEVGDEVLRTLAELLLSSFRSADYVIRFGGDEFVAVMTGITIENIGIVTEKFNIINKYMSKPKDGLPSVALSAGAAFSEHGFSDNLFAEADGALYRAKANGRRRCFCGSRDISNFSEREE